METGTAMTTPPARPPEQDGFAVSPGIGIVPAIYVPRSPERTVTPWRDLAVAVARQARGWYQRLFGASNQVRHSRVLRPGPVEAVPRAATSSRPRA
jgi:hypothetical protein